MSQKSTQMPQTPAEATTIVEKRISHEGFNIKCDKCKGVTHTMKSTTKTVTIGGKPILTEKDKIMALNVPLFSICSTTGTSCTPKFEKWIDIAEPSLNSEKIIPLVEHSDLICSTGGGIVSFEPPAAKSEFVGPKKPNIVDKAQSKINGVANKAANMAKKTTDAISAKIGTALDSLKPIGQVFDTPEIQNMITGAKEALNQANLTKEQVDQQLANLEQKIPELKSKISDTINGIKLPSLEDTGVFDIFNSGLESGEQTFIGQGIQDSINALEDHFNTQINTANLLNLDGSSGGNISIPSAFSNKGPLEQWLERKNQDQKRLEAISKAEYDNLTEQVTSINKDASFDNGEDSKKALALLYSLYVPSQAGPIPMPGQGEIPKILKNKAKDRLQDSADRKISRAKSKLNNKLQSEFDEKLQKLGYDKAQKKIDKAQAKSADLQEDLDKAEKYLGRLDDFGGYIDSLKEKYIGKVTDKYTNAIAKAGQNLSLLNVSMDGMSFIVDGLPPGDVVTNVKAKQEKEKPKKEEPEKAKPVVVKDPPPLEKAKPETEEKCCFTKLTVIKNKTIEYKVIDEPNNIKNELPLLNFVAGTTENNKDLSILLEGLDRSGCSSEHKNKELNYTIDASSFSKKLTDNQKNKLDFNIKSNDDFVDIAFNFMGLNSEPTEYKIPINTCSNNEIIRANTYIDANWFLLFAMKSDTLSYRHANYKNPDFLKEHRSKAVKIGQRNRGLSGRDSGAKIELAYGFVYNNETIGKELSHTINLEKIAGYSKRVFNILKRVEEISDKARDFQTKVGSRPMVFEGHAPNINVMLSRYILDTDGNEEPKYDYKLKYGLEPIVGLVIKMDVSDYLFASVKVFKIIYDKLIKKKKHKPGKEKDKNFELIFKCELSLDLQFSASGEIDLGENSKEFSFVTTAVSKLEIFFSTKAVVKGFGLEGGITGSAAGQITADNYVGVDDNGSYWGTKVSYSGLKLSYSVTLSVYGFSKKKDLIEDSGDWIFYKPSNPLAETGRIPIS